MRDRDISHVGSLITFQKPNAYLFHGNAVHVTLMIPIIPH